MKKLVFLMLIFLLVMTGIAFAEKTELVSVSSEGEQANDASTAPSISADGRFVAFCSDANNLVPNDTNNRTDIFVVDKLTGVIELVSLSSDGVQANGTNGYYGLSVSANGRFVAFDSNADNLIFGDENSNKGDGGRDIFVHDRQTGKTDRVSVSSEGAEANSDSSYPSISGDGRFVAFASNSDNLVSDDMNNQQDIFVYDRQTGKTECVSVSSDGVQADGRSKYPAISADGRFVAFDSFANNLVQGDTNGDGLSGTFVHDRQTGITQRVSVSSDGIQANASSGGFKPSISADGRFVAFQSYASNLVSDDTNEKKDIFVHDCQTSETERVSVSSDGVQANGASDSYGLSMSADGRFVVFDSDADNLVTSDTNNNSDVFIHDRQTGKTERISVSSVGVQANSASGSYGLSISADGNFVAFDSEANNLVANDTNGVSDIFVYEMGISVDSITLNKTTLPINKGSNETLTATINPTDATNKNVTWKSSNDLAATVDSNGKVTAVGAGNCDITVTTVDGSKTDTCKVTVSVPVTGVILNQNILPLDKGAASSLIATISPSDATNKNVTWKSSDTSVATVDNNGKVTAIAGGTCKITVTSEDGGKTADCVVDVQKVIYFTIPTSSDDYLSNAKTISIGGIKDVSITKASWKIDNKRKGTCKISGGSWSAGKVGLVLGDNIITVTGTTKNKYNFTDTLNVNYIDNTPPILKISKPASPTTKQTIKISGTAKDLELIANVTWKNDTTGESGICPGTNSWKSPNIALKLGDNQITITALDNSGNKAQASIVVKKQDKTKPGIKILLPTSKSGYTINTNSINISGIASDNEEVTEVSWSNAKTGASGFCTGTENWLINNINLDLGPNAITITAKDSSGNAASKKITVSYKL